MSTHRCATESVKPAWVTIAFILGSLIMLIATIIISMARLKQKRIDTINTKQRTNTIDIKSEEKEEKEEKEFLEKEPVKVFESEWDKADGCFGKLKLCAKDVWGRKAVYLPLISHLSDTATDFAAVVEFGIVAVNSDPSDCGVNVWYLFALSIGCMILYRAV
eukprot:430221_1